MVEGREEVDAWFWSSSTPSTLIPIYILALGFWERDQAYLVLEIIPEVWPGLLYTSLLLDHGLLYDATEDSESHSYSMIIIAVYTSASLELIEGFPKDDDPIFKLVGLHAEFS